ncbi:hypothetical protein D3C85_1612830 [compost metagenome]
MAGLLAVVGLGGAEQAERGCAAARVVGEVVGMAVVVRVGAFAVGDPEAVEQGVAAAVEEIETRQDGGAVVVDHCETRVLAVVLQLFEDIAQGGLRNQ